MSLNVIVSAGKPRLRALLDHFAIIEDPREPWRVAHPLQEVLLLVVCGTIADCDDYEGIAEWGEAHLSFLRRFLRPRFISIGGAIYQSRLGAERQRSGCGGVRTGG